MILWLLAAGAISMLGQVVLLRELNVAFFGSELIYVLALGAWLLGTAAGAVAGRRSHVPSARSIRWIFVLIGLTVALSLVLARGARLLFHGVPGAYLPFGLQMLALCACVVPVSFLLGVIFQRIAKRFVEPAHGRRSLATAYAIESAGAAAGGLLAALFLAASASNLLAGLLCVLVAGCAALAPPSASSVAGVPDAKRRDAPAIRRPSAARTRAPLLAAAALCSLALLSLFFVHAIDRKMTAWNHPGLLETRDTPYGRVTVSENGGQIAVFENDALAYESEGTAAEEFVHLAAVQRPSPRSVLVLGGAAQGLIHEILRLEPDRVDDLELDRALLDLVVPRLAEESASLEDPRVRMLFGDPRRLVTNSMAYDLILIGMPEPESGSANRYYTREFFASCAMHLEPNGVLALRLRSAENLWTPQLARRAASIHGALNAALPYTVVLPGTTNLLLASSAPLESDPVVLGDRLRERHLPTELVTPSYIRYLYENDRFREAAEIVARTPAPVNSDGRPYCYQSTMLLWLARFFPRLSQLSSPIHRVHRALFAGTGGVAILALLVFGRRRASSRRALLAFLAGFAGMALEAALLLQFQTRSGVLYQDLGLLLTLFMAGLAAGAAGFEAIARGRWERGEQPDRSGRSHLHVPVPAGDGPWCATDPVRRWGRAAIGGFVVLGLASAVLLHSGGSGGLTATGALLFACGFFVAAAFAYATVRGAPEQLQIIGPVYAADLVGGCLGSLVAGLVTIPMLGLAATALVAAVAAMAAWVEA